MLKVFKLSAERTLPTSKRTQEKLSFPSFDRRRIEGTFQVGDASSDGGNIAVTFCLIFPPHLSISVAFTKTVFRPPRTRFSPRRTYFRRQRTNPRRSIT